MPFEDSGSLVSFERTMVCFGRSCRNRNCLQDPPCACALIPREAPVQLRQPHKSIRHVDLTDVQLASSETARGINRNIVLELIRANQPLSRADISRHSGLQRSTVSQIVEQLIRENWVREGAV